MPACRVLVLVSVEVGSSDAVTLCFWVELGCLDKLHKGGILRSVNSAVHHLPMGDKACREATRFAEDP